MPTAVMNTVSEPGLRWNRVTQEERFKKRSSFFDKPHSQNYILSGTPGATRTRARGLGNWRNHLIKAKQILHYRPFYT